MAETTFTTLAIHLYVLLQRLIHYLFAPRPPPAQKAAAQYHGRIAIIGAGLSGVSAAAHCVSHGYDVVIFEKSGNVGGIWGNVNHSSGLQISSVMYRWHPAVTWKSAYPDKEEIMDEILKVFKMYKLEDKTRLKTKVMKIERGGKESDEDMGNKSVWYVNGNHSEPFDAVIAALGTCGPPLEIPFPGRDDFEKHGGKVVHSSQLDDLHIKGKKVVIIGSGASGVEALEYCVDHGAKTIDLIARTDKWIIPRHLFFDSFVALFPGRETFFSIIPEFFLRRFFYGKELAFMVPQKGLFTGTPCVNSKYLGQIRSGEANYVQGDTVKFSSHGLVVKVKDESDNHISTKAASSKSAPLKTKAHHLHNHHDQNGKTESKSTIKADELEFKADVIIYATGFKKPNFDFIPHEFIAEPFAPPNCFIQTISVHDSSLMLLNCTFKDAIGTVGHYHLGIYTRILLLFLSDLKTAPYPELMQLWVRFVNLWKTKDPQSRQAMSFITYFEINLWFALLAVNPFRLRYYPYILFGWRSSHFQKKAATRDEQLETRRKLVGKVK